MQRSYTILDALVEVETLSQPGRPGVTVSAGPHHPALMRQVKTRGATRMVTITIAVDGKEYEVLTVDPTTLEARDSTDDVVSLFGRGLDRDGAPSLREIVEAACEESYS